MFIPLSFQFLGTMLNKLMDRGSTCFNLYSPRNYLFSSLHHYLTFRSIYSQLILLTFLIFVGLELFQIIATCLKFMKSWTKFGCCSQLLCWICLSSTSDFPFSLENSCLLFPKNSPNDVFRQVAIYRHLWFRNYKSFSVIDI